MSKNVATAFTTANQNNAGWYFLFIFQKQTTAADFFAQRS
jgi:hypothetical protein